MGLMKRIGSEPLVHFLVAGALLFVVGGALGDPQAGEDIRITPELVEALQADYERKRGQAPEADAVEGLVQSWIDEELLHREARRLEMGVGDPVIRRRLVQAMRFLVEDQAVIRQPSDAELGTWLEAHRQSYQLPARVSFEHVFFPRKEGDSAALGRARVARGVGPEPQAGTGEPFVHGSSLVGMSRARVEASFGSDFSNALFELESGIWSAPIRSSFGYHLVRISTKEPSRLGRVDELRERLQADWLNHERDLAVDETIASLREGYRVTREDQLP